MKQGDVAMALKLYKGLRAMFANPQTERDQIEKWVKTEYGADWQWALHQYKITGKVPATGVKQ